MEIHQLTIFLEVARRLSFTRTAAALNYVQSNVTAQIKKLEAELGVCLFERLGKRVQLTESGERLAAYAERILALEQEARAAVASQTEPSGTLTVGAAETVLAYRLPPVIRLFQERFPKVELLFRPGACASLRQELRAGTLAVAFLLEESDDREALSLECLGPEPMVLVAHPNHRLVKAASSRSLADLDGETVLLTEKGCAYRSLFERALGQAQVHPIQFSNVEAIKQCAAAGVGVAYLPRITVESALRDGWLGEVQWEVPGSEIYTSLSVHKAKWTSPALRAFLDVTTEVFARAPDAPGTRH